MNLDEILQHIQTINKVIKKYRLRPIWFAFLGAVYAYFIQKGIVENWTDINNMISEYGVKPLLSTTFELFAFTGLLMLAILHMIKKKFPGVKAVFRSMLCGLFLAVGFPLAVVGDITWDQQPFIFTIFKDICFLMSFLLMPGVCWRGLYSIAKRVV